MPENSQKRKNDSQVIGHHALFGGMRVIASSKHVGEIGPMLKKDLYIRRALHCVALSQKLNREKVGA
jgi:hypothetical protein